MRISDWSSDVCSSDLITLLALAFGKADLAEQSGAQGKDDRAFHLLLHDVRIDDTSAVDDAGHAPHLHLLDRRRLDLDHLCDDRSEAFMYGAATSDIFLAASKESGARCRYLQCFGGVRISLQHAQPEVPRVRSECHTSEPQYLILI